AMVFLACAPGVGLVEDADVVDLELDVVDDVDVEVLVSVLEPQPASARLTATTAITAVRSFINCISRIWVPVPAPATSALRLAEPARNAAGMDARL
ncbi:hypothetical protein B1T45_10755, partial [Mycobacterium kansasii]